MFSAMINQQHIIVQIIYGIAWSLAMSLTTFGAFVSVSLWMSERRLYDDTFEDVIKREIEKLSSKQTRLLWIVVFICTLCWIIVLLPGAFAPFN